MSDCPTCGHARNFVRGGFRNGKPRWRWSCNRCQRRRNAKPSVQEAKRKWNKANKVKRRGHKAVENALLRGDLQREPCTVCGNPNSEAHHEDYSRPLDVEWLCHKHHMERHRKAA